MSSGLLNRYKIIPEPVKASFWFTISSVIQKGIALVSTPIFTRIMTTEQYGTYSVFQSWYSIIMILATLNLFAGVYNNGMTKWPEKRKQYTSSLQGLSTTVTAILFLVYIFGRNYWNDLLGLSTLMLVTMFAQIFFVPAFNFWSSSQRYDYKYVKLVVITILMAIISTVIGIVSVLGTEYKVEAMILSYALVQVCIGLFFYVYNWKEGKQFFSKSFWKFALVFNIPLIPHYLSQTVLNQADRIMINNMVGSNEAAIYSVAYTFSMMFTIVTNAINSSFIPYTYKSLKEKNYTGLRNNASFLVVLVGIACIMAMGLGVEFIKIFAAPEYYEARWVMIPTAEALLFLFIYPLFCNIEFYFEKTKFIMIASGSAAVINIVLNYLFIPRFGYIAAAYTTLVCYILLTFAHYAAYRWIKKENNIDEELYDLKIIISISAISLIFMLIMLISYDYFYIRMTIISCMLIGIFIKRKFIVYKLKSLKYDK